MVDSALKSAGWERIDSRLGDITSIIAGKRSGHITLEGVQAFIAATGDEEILPAMVQLSAALSDNGLPCVRHRTEDLVNKIPKAIMVAIGSKPRE